MGQVGSRIDRFSIRFHMIGAGLNSYVRYNLIHNTFNRAIAIQSIVSPVGRHARRLLQHATHVPIIEGLCELTSLLVVREGDTTIVELPLGTVDQPMWPAAQHLPLPS